MVIKDEFQKNQFRDLYKTRLNVLTGEGNNSVRIMLIVQTRREINENLS